MIDTMHEMINNRQRSWPW